MNLEAIAYTEDTNDPVFEMREGDSYITFMYLDDVIRVHHAYSEVEGDFSDMVDRMVRICGCQEVEFFNVIGADLLEKVDYDETYEVMTPDGKSTVLRATWNNER